MITLYMSQKNNPVIINEGAFSTETGILTLEISLDDYSLTGKTITAVFSQTAVETASLTVTNGLIQLPITLGLLVAGENQIQLNIREGLTLEQSPIMKWTVELSVAGTDPAPTDVDIITELLAEAGDIVDTQMPAFVAALNTRIDEIITTPAESVSAQEIIDARGGEATLGGRFNAQLADNEKYEIKGSSYGVDVDNADNHDQIIAALDVLVTNGGGTLRLPYGTIKTSPISFEGYNNIVIKGVGRSYPLTINTTIKIIGTNPTGSVGLQFSDTANPYVGGEWQAKFCKLEGIFLDCDNKCDIGINGNRGLELKDVTVRRAVTHGIQLEDYTYPVYLEQVESSYNGGHGLYVRGKMTTVYRVKDSEFTGNGGYGLLIEGGASVLFDNVLAQSNDVGGLKINKIAGYSGSYFLNGMMFINFYTEANGTLDVGDALYDGNNAVFITGYDKTNVSTGKPGGINFVGGKLNGTKALKIDAVWGCKFDGTAINGTADIESIGAYGIEITTVPTVASLLDVGDSLAVTSSFRQGTPKGIVYNGGIFPTRGRVLVLEFYLATIAAEATVNMSTLYQEMTGLTMGKGYSMMSDGSILGLRLVKKNAGNAGTITCKPVVYGGPGIHIDPTNAFAGGFVDLVLPCTTLNTISDFYAPGSFNFLQGSSVGIQLTASADYVAGTYDGYIAQLMIEI